MKELAAALASLVSLGLEGRFWREVPAVPGWWVSNHGEIASLKGRTPRLLRPMMCGQYRAVGTMTRKFYVHALVLEAFRGPRPEGMQARHLDGNRFNNRADNLAWGTPSENNRDKERHGTGGRGERNPMARLTQDRVKEMRRLHSAGGLTFKALASRFGVSAMTAWRAVQHHSWTA